MNIALTSEQEVAIECLVAAGLFPSKEAAIARSHDWLTEEAAKLEALRADIQVGIEQADRGEFSSMTAQELKDSIRARLTQTQQTGE